MTAYMYIVQHDSDDNEQIQTTHVLITSIKQSDVRCGIDKDTFVIESLRN